MKVKYLIRNGMVVDGSGAPAYRADVRISDGKIAKIATELQPEGLERVIDATDCYVTPGLIEIHNHWDGAMWWSPMMEPMAAYGITTSVNGNCGFSLAPLNTTQDLRQEIVDIFNYFEDVPDKSLKSVLAWDWHSWREYKASVQRNVKVPVNIAAFCGHVALRLAVLGLEAWERAATPAETERMCALLEDALSAGALGLSSNLLDYDKHERPLPSQHADDAEWLGLMRVLAGHPGVTLQIILDNFLRKTAAESTERIARLAKQAGPFRIQLAGLVPHLKFQEQAAQVQDTIFQRLKSEGLDIWAGFSHVAPTLHVNFHASLLFAQMGNFVWQEIVNETNEENKLVMLADPQWRARARESWDNQYSHSMLNDPTGLLLKSSETGYGPVDITLAEYMREKNIKHPSDAMAEWALHNGPQSSIRMREWDVNSDIVVKLVRESNAIGSLSDAGAHTTLFCGTGNNVMFLTDYARDRQLITIEEAVHVLTGKAANHFGFHDRGKIEVGKRADIAVFNLAEVERRRETKVWDVPDGFGGRAYRYSRDPAPMRLTLVNGVATFDNGEVTGNFPGEFIGPQGIEPPVAPSNTVKPAGGRRHPLKEQA